MFCVGLGVFTAASGASALAPGVQALIVTRALQGAGAAIVTPLTLTLISEAFPVQKRSAAIGLWGGIVGLAVAAGPVIGGAVVSGIDWHWIFWLNVPIGVTLIPTASRRLTESCGPRPQLDLAGLALAGLGVLGLTWGAIRANTSGFASPEVVIALAAGLLLVAAFIAWERHATQPMVSPALFRSRTFTAANGVSFFMYAGLFGALFFGVAILAAVFIHHGGYHTAKSFFSGFTAAIWVAVGLSAIGIIAASLTGGPRLATADEPITIRESHAVAA